MTKIAEIEHDIKMTEITAQSAMTIFRVNTVTKIAPKFDERDVGYACNKQLRQWAAEFGINLKQNKFKSKCA